MKKNKIYGGNNTIHKTEFLNVEVDKKTGRVVAVWFRCMPLPFREEKSSNERTKELDSMYKDVKHSLISIELKNLK